MYKIGICGKAKSGKNTVASIILEELAKSKNKNNLLSKTIAFADPIKEIIIKMFPTADSKCLFGSSELRSSFIEGGTFDNNGNKLTYRQALMDIGDLARKYKSSIWVDCFEKAMKEAVLENSKLEAVIAPDLRFYEELTFLKQNNFFLIKINRDDVTRINHTSDTVQEQFKISDFNFILDNNKNLENLRLEIKNNLIPLLMNSST